MRVQVVRLSLPAVDSVDTFGFGVVEQAKGIAADSRGTRFRHIQGGRHGNRGVGSISACL